MKRPLAGLLRRRRGGFTLLEVMIAVVILAIGLSSLFTSEAGAIRIAQRARTTTIATLLARCKMAEIEERVLKEGWPGTLLEERDECCEGGEHEGFRCEWKVERVKLPDMGAETEEGKEGGDAKDGKGGGEGEKSAGKPPNVLDQLVDVSKGAPEERMNTITDMLSGGGVQGGDERGGGSSSYGFGDGGMTNSYDDEGELDPIGSMVMGIAFPIMKPVIEEGVRRATVKVLWNEGDRERNFEVVQFLVSEQQLILPDGEEDGGVGSPTSPTQGTGAAGSPAGTPGGGAVR